MMRNYSIRTVFILVLSLAYKLCQAKNLTAGQEFQYKPIITDVPFLYFKLDFRYETMRNVSVSTSLDANSQNWNHSKYVFSFDFNNLMISTPKANLNFGCVYNINFYF